MRDAQVLGTGGAYRSRAAADGGQRLGSALGQFFRLMIQTGKHRIHPGTGDTVQRLIGRKQIVQIIAVALCAGHPARAGVGLLQKAKLSKCGHLIAQRCAGYRHVEVVGQDAAAHRLPFEAVQSYDRLQHTLLPCIHRHSVRLPCVVLKCLALVVPEC